MASTPTLAPTQLFGQPLMMPAGWRPTGTETEAGGGMTLAPREVNLNFGETIIQAGGRGGVEEIRRVVEDHLFGSYSELKAKLGG